MGNRIPGLKLELESVKQYIATMLIDRNNEINEMVLKTLDRTLNEEWVAREISEQVRECVKNAISDMTEVSELTYTIKEVLAKHISSVIEEREKS